MKIVFRCGCGGVNYNLNDWICHFQYKGFWNGIKNLLRTEIELRRW